MNYYTCIYGVYLPLVCRLHWNKYFSKFEGTSGSGKMTKIEPRRMLMLSSHRNQVPLVEMINYCLQLNRCRNADRGGSKRVHHLLPEHEGHEPVLPRHANSFVIILIYAPVSRRAAQRRSTSVGATSFTRSWLSRPKYPCPPYYEPSTSALCCTGREETFAVCELCLARG